jgi:flagellar basal-body rod protein FlgB
MDSLATPVGAAVATALDALSLRQQAIAANLANANSAGFRANEVDFEEALRSALADVGIEREETLQRLTELRQGLQSGDYTRAAQNAGVELDMELARMSETVLRYHALIQGLGKYASLARMAITGEVKS